MKAVTPTTQLTLCLDERKCYMGDYPTLGLLKSAYGMNAPIMWLLPQLYNLSEYCGAKAKLEDGPLYECAAILASRYYYLKTSELMLFFFRFKSASYSEFYGSVDPLKIMASMHQFIRERNTFLMKMEQEARERKQEEDAKNSMSYVEYCRQEGIDPKENIKRLFG